MINEFLLSINTKSPSLSVFFITIVFLFFLISLFLNRNSLYDFLRKIKRKYWFFLLLILILSLFLRVIYIPHHHKMYVDEPMYMEQAKIMITHEDYSQKTYAKSIGWPFFMKWFFITFGINNWIALYLSSILGGLTVVNVFLLAYVLFKKENIALWSSFLFSLISTHISWAVSAENHMSSLFFLSLSLWICCLYIKEYKLKELLLLLSGLAFAVQFRPENYLFILPVFYLLIYKNKKYFNIKNIALILIFLILIIPNFVRIYSFQVIESHQDALEKNVQSEWNPNFLIKNSKELFRNIFLNYAHPFVFSFILLLGIYYSFLYNKIKRKHVYFLIFSSIISVIWIFPYYFYGNRFIITTYLFLSLYAGLGVYFVLNRIVTGLIKNKKHQKQIAILITTLLLLLFFPYISRTNDLWLPHALETKIPELAEKEVPKECIVISEWPVIFLSTTNIQVLKTQNFLDNNLFNSKKCLLFFEDMFCDGTFDRSPNCQRIKKEYKTIPFLTYNITKEEKDGVLKKEYIFHKLIEKY